MPPRGVREGLGRFRALLKRAESGSIPLPGPSKTHCPALAFHAPPVAAHFALSGSRFLDSGFAYTRNDNGNGDSAFGGIPCASGGVLTKERASRSDGPPVLFCRPTLCKQACNGGQQKSTAASLRCPFPRGA